MLDVRRKGLRMTMNPKVHAAKRDAVSTKWQTALVSRTKRERAKPFHIAAQPNNRILWRDDSFVRRNLETVGQYRVMPSTTWHAELGRNADHTSMLKEGDRA